MGESVHGKISDQQRLILDRLRHGRLETHAANEAMSARASTIVGASGVMFSVATFLVGTTKGDLEPWPLVAMTICCAAFLLSVVLATGIWVSRDAHVVGSDDVSHLYQHYIDEDLDRAIIKLMVDEADVFTEELNRNAFVASRLQRIALAADVQAIGLLAAAATVSW